MYKAGPGSLRCSGASLPRTRCSSSSQGWGGFFIRLKALVLEVGTTGSMVVHRWVDLGVTGHPSLSLITTVSTVCALLCMRCRSVMLLDGLYSCYALLGSSF